MKARSGIPLPLLASLLVALSGAAESAPDAPSFTRFSGTWKGSYAVLQRGRCTLGRGPRLDAQTQVALTVREDGSFAAKVTSIRFIGNPSHVDIGAQFPVEGDPGAGQFQADLSFRLKTPRRAYCSGAVRNFDVEYAGKVVEHKGKTVMEMKAPVEPCPEYDRCLFESVLKLTKE